MAEAVKDSMTVKTRLSVLLLSTPVLVFVVVGGLMGNTSARAGDDTLRHVKVFDDVVSLVLNYYVEEVKIDRAMEGAMKGLADGLDPDSAYLNSKQLAEVQASAPLPEGDVGLELTRQYYLRVIAARDGSPAAKAGLQTGDYVRGIDGRSTREISVLEGTRMLHGQPGSKVMLTVIRGNAAEPHEMTLVREKPGATAVTGHLVGTEIGYVRVASFRNGALDQLKKQVADLSHAGAKSLILDIRHTAEGSYDNGIAAARLFVKSGTLVIKAGREAEKQDNKGAAREPISAAAGDGSIELPTQILVTTGTSGAAELFAAALSGNKRAELVGERTLGRAGIQKLIRLPENRGLWLTYARYLTPAGEAIQGKGLKPGVEIEDVDVTEFGAPAPDKDPILDAAIARASKKAA
jgi:carboxyl-terminal processing protease